MSEDRANCWDALHKEEHCCRGLVAPPKKWRPVPRHAPEARCLEAVLARPLKLTTVGPGCEGRFFYVAQLGKTRLRMDYDTTAQPWFLRPRWNTSGWAEHISHFGPQGVHDHKVLGGLCLPSACDVSSTAQFLAPRVAPWWGFPLLEPWPLNGSHVLLPPPLGVSHRLFPDVGDHITMWVSKSSCEAPLVKPDFCEAFWQFAVLEWHPWHWRLNASSLTMAAAMVVSILSLLAGLGLVAFGKPVEVRNSRADVFRVLLTLVAVWAHTFSHGSWLPVEKSSTGYWFASHDLTYKVNLGFVVLSTHLRLSSGRSGSRFPVAKAAARRWIQLGLPLCFWIYIYLYIFVDIIPMNNLMKSSGLHRWYSEKRSECRRPAHLVLSLLLLHEPITGNNSPCHNLDIFESQFLLDLLVVFLISVASSSTMRQIGMKSWLLWYVSILWRYDAIRDEEDNWAYAYSHSFKMLLPSALSTIILWSLLPFLRSSGGVWSDLLGLMMVCSSCIQDQRLFGEYRQLLFKPLQRAVVFHVWELFFVLGMLLLLRPKGSTGGCFRVL